MPYPAAQGKCSRTTWNAVSSRAHCTERLRCRQTGTRDPTQPTLLAQRTGTGCWPALHLAPPPAAAPPPPWAGLAAAGCSRGPGRLALAPAQTCCWPVGERSVIGGGGPLAHGPRRRWLQSAVSSYHDSTSPEQHIKSRRRAQQRKHVAAAHPNRGVLVDDAPQAGKVLPQPRIVPHVAAAAGVAAGVGVKRLRAGDLVNCGGSERWHG